MILTANYTKHDMTDKLTPPLTLKEQVRIFEKKIIQETLVLNNGNKTKVCAILGVDRKTLYNKLKG